MEIEEKNDDIGWDLHDKNKKNKKLRQVDAANDKNP